MHTLFFRHGDGMESFLDNHIIMASSFGYSYNKIILDESGKPTDYVILEVNPAYEDMIEAEHGSVAGKRVTEVIPGITADSYNWIECFGTVALGGERLEFDAYSGVLDCWYHMSVISPKREYFAVLSFDISKQKKTEQRLQISEEKNRKYIENAPDGILIADKTLRYIDANAAACSILGYTREELTSLSIPDLISPDETGKYQKSLAKVLGEGHSRRVGRFKRKDGTFATVLTDTVLMKDGTIMSFCKDISQYERLEKEKNQYYSAFQTTPQPIIITDSKGTIVSVNAALLDIYGYERSELIGNTPRILNPGREVYENLGTSAEKYDAQFKDLWESVSDPAIRTWKGELINRKKDNSLIWVNLLVNGVFDDENKLISIVGLPFDMTVSHELAVKNRVQLFKTIADMAELRDDDTGNHMKRVGLFAKLLARGYGLPEKYCNDIEIFAPMHDIGKVGILDVILRAPRKLTSEEFEIMKTHTLLGHNIIKGKDEFEMAAAITLCHHEKFDGSGYPKGLSGKQIPMSAQFTAISDVYDALRSKRPYKEPWTHGETVKLILSNSASHFDPDYVQVFAKLQDRFEAVYQELMD